MLLSRLLSFILKLTLFTLYERGFLFVFLTYRYRQNYSFSSSFLVGKIIVMMICLISLTWTVMEVLRFEMNMISLLLSKIALLSL